MDQLDEKVLRSEDSTTTSPLKDTGGTMSSIENISAAGEPKGDGIVGLRTRKAQNIWQACELRDINALIHHATTDGGLLGDDLRKSAWPILLNIDRQQPNDLGASWEELPRHSDEDQVRLDVDRSFVYYPQGTEDEISTKKTELSRLITQVLRRYPMLCYFQGYHDIAQVLLLVLGEREATPALVQVSLFRIRDYMLPSLSPAVKHLHLIPAIIEKVNPRLRDHLSCIRPFFALAATLTLYAHDIQEYSDIARLFDFLLAHEPVVSIYLFAAIIISRKKELLEIPRDEPEMLHFTLSKLPNPLDLETLISDTVRLFEDFPPETLPRQAWKHVPDCSVLKTSRDVCAPRMADEAVRLLERQTRQLRREELKKKALSTLWKHRRTVGSITLAFAFGALAFWIRKNGFDSSLWIYFQKAKLAVFHR